MSFERNRDPKDAMVIGRKKDSIQVTKITCFIMGSPVEIKNDDKIELFLKNFDNGQVFETIFSPSIVRISHWIWEEDNISRLLAMMAPVGAPPSSSKPVDKPALVRAEKELFIEEYAGKTAFFNGKFFQLPSIEKCSKLVEGEREEQKRINEERQAKSAIMAATLRSWESVGMADLDAAIDVEVLKQTMKLPTQAQMEERQKKEKEVNNMMKSFNKMLRNVF